MVVLTLKPVFVGFEETHVAPPHIYTGFPKNAEHLLIGNTTRLVTGSRGADQWERGEASRLTKGSTSTGHGGKELICRLAGGAVGGPRGWKTAPVSSKLNNCYLLETNDEGQTRNKSHIILSDASLDSHTHLLVCITEPSNH